MKNNRNLEQILVKTLSGCKFFSQRTEWKNISLNASIDISKLNHPITTVDIGRVPMISERCAEHRIERDAPTDLRWIHVGNNDIYAIA